ncbi:replication initiator protein [Apis mellifera associated microvirus 8]|nr:replication initiator protein [Apis mellifera associated microvirus 8]
MGEPHMTCFHPLTAFKTGSGDIIFHDRHKNITEKLKLPCGQCVGCRLERSRQWAIRCMHEAQMHKDNCFITLTYAPEHLPSDRSLHLDHFQKFMKRLRKKFGSGIRFYHCGEYGSTYGRPHYHACIFGFDFADKKLWKIVNNERLYTSLALEKLWPYGFSTVGTVTFESAAYVARYILKKVNGDAAAKHYERIDPNTGEVFRLKPEYTTMSRRPGIGSTWFDKYHSDVYPHDRVVVRSKCMRPPKFYDTRYEILDPEGFDSVKQNRQLNALKHVDNNTPDRLEVRERVQKIALQRLPRNLD